jgi:hypothetical protein
MSSVEIQEIVLLLAKYVIAHNNFNYLQNT